MSVLLVDSVALLAINQQPTNSIPDVGREDIGAWLRQARERSGVSLRQIADVTNMSVRTFELLERNRIALLPGGIYRRAIVRAYAKEIGLDPEETLRTFLAQYPDDLPLPKAAAPIDAPPSRPIHHRVVGVIGALIPITAGILYFSLARGSDLPVHTAASTVNLAPIPDADAIQHASQAAARSVAMMISVSARTALQVVVDGREVLARQVHPGELVRLDLGSDVVLMGDNAGAVHFSINGRAGRSLGDSGTPLSVRIARDTYQALLIQP